jgi:hypothetical protein
MESNMSSIKATAAAFDLPLVKDFPMSGNSYTSKGGSKTARSLNTTMRLGNPQGGTYVTLEPNDLPSSVRGGRS